MSKDTLQRKAQLITTRFEHVVGYAHDLAHSREYVRQLRILEEVGCRRIYTDVSVSRFKHREGREQMLDSLSGASVILLPSLSVLAASKIDLVAVVNQINSLNAQIYCLDASFLFNPTSFTSQLHMSLLTFKAERRWHQQRYTNTHIDFDERDLILMGKKLFVEGMSVEALAKQYDVSTSMIANNQARMARACFEIWGRHLHML